MLVGMFLFMCNTMHNVEGFKKTVPSLLWNCPITVTSHHLAMFIVLNKYTRLIFFYSKDSKILLFTKHYLIKTDIIRYYLLPNSSLFKLYNKKYEYLTVQNKHTHTQKSIEKLYFQAKLFFSFNAADFGK